MNADAVNSAKARALEVFAAMRAHGARFYKEYLSIDATPLPDGSSEAIMPAVSRTRGADDFVAAGVLATLADIALGTSTRAFVPRGHRVATVGLTIQFTREAPLVGNIYGRAEVVSATDHAAVSQCRVTDDGRDLLAIAIGSFAIRPVPEAGAWLPYSQDDLIAGSSLPPITPEELSSEEQWLLSRVKDSLKNHERYGPYAGYLGIEWLKQGGGESAGVWPLGSHLWNRVEHVHGGALFGALSVAAQACLPDGLGARIVEQHVQYVRPGAGKTLHVRASLLRRGERLSSVHAGVTDEAGQSVAHSLVTLEITGRT